MDYEFSLFVLYKLLFVVSLCIEGDSSTFSPAKSIGGSKYASPPPAPLSGFSFQTFPRNLSGSEADIFLEQ